MINKTILILGGSGALGKTLIKRYHNDNELIIFSRDEHKQVNLMKDYKNIKFEIGDIRRRDSIVTALNKYKPHILINAAAQKHIHICEWNPYESVQTNILGNQNIVEAIEIAKHKIEGVIFTSTDKACKPINVYGMCKSISERIYQNFAEHNSDIKVTIVRYGNVLESTGSVIPFFKNILNSNEDDLILPVTHIEMTRFFLTLDKAVTLLIDWAYKNTDSHGCIAIPKTPSLRIVELAHRLIVNSGKDADIKIIGIRPGEKLHEELISPEESLKTKEYNDYYLITNEIQTSSPWSYTSKSDLIINNKKIDDFLKDSGVI